MIIRSRHRTIYRYSSPSVDSQNEVRLKPLTDENQTCRSFELSVSPETKVFSHEEIGGTVHHFTLRGPHRQLEIIAEAEVETLKSNTFQSLNLLEPDWSYYDLSATKQYYAEYLSPSAYIGIHPEASALASHVKLQSGVAVAQFLLNLNLYMSENFDYDKDVTHVHSTVDEVLRLRAGVCQDFAHVMIACCRSQGIPARYVSGYMYVDDGGGMRGNEAMHAWMEAAMPSGAWVAFDPTNSLLANDCYVRVHVGRDYSEVAPTRGVYIGAPAESLEVSLSLERLCPTVTD